MKRLISFLLGSSLLFSSMPAFAAMNPGSAAALEARNKIMRERMMQIRSGLQVRTLQSNEWNATRRGLKKGVVRTSGRVMDEKSQAKRNLLRNTHSQCGDLSAYERQTCLAKQRKLLFKAKKN